MLDLLHRDDGVILGVRVQPGARRNAILGVHDQMLKVAVVAAPEGGKANEAIVELLSAKLKIPRKKVCLLAGQTSRQKKFLLVGASIEAVSEMIEGLLRPE